MTSQISTSFVLVAHCIPLAHCNLSMAPTIFLLIVSGLLFASTSYAWRKRSSTENPIDKIRAQETFSPSQFAGKWHLVAVASKCAELRNSYRKADGVNIMVTINDTIPQSPMLVDTFYPKDYFCWEVKQVYSPTTIPGRFLLTGYGPPVDIVVGETDYSSYAIIFYQKSQEISVKLYGRTARLSDAITDKFDQMAADVGLSEEFLFYFRHYGFCHKAHEFRILDETTLMGAS